MSPSQRSGTGVRRRSLLAAVGTALGVATAGCADPATQARPLTVTSPALSGGSLPVEYTCDGAGRSPPLRVESAPRSTAAFAVTAESDREAIIEPVLWSLWNVPADRREIPAGLPHTATVASLGGARQGRDAGTEPGYRAPCPSSGVTESYRFQLYCLDEALSLSGGAAHDDALDAISAAAIASQRFVVEFTAPQ